MKTGSLHELRVLPVKKSGAERQRGSALVVVLAMVVLLTALIVAFFSRAMLEQQISSSSANRTKVELFAQGAVNVIQAELKQEVIMTSNAVSADATTLYRRKSGDFESVQPSRGSLRPLIGDVSGTRLPNLVAVSMYDEPLYASGIKRASSALSSGMSLNGRNVSMENWNQPLLLPKQNPDETDVAPDINIFPADGSRAPNWILVSRDGDNPKDWSENLRAGGSSEVTGRYAFMIYNEGGLLDANVAGSPQVNGADKQAWSKKGSAAFADLTVMRDAMNRQVFEQDDVDQLVGWRNAAVVEPQGIFPNFSDLNVTDWLNYVLGSGARNQFMNVSGTSLVGGGQKSNQAFTSRQQLIAFLTEGLSGSQNTKKARMQNALQYLGTFSRSLNRPSYWHEWSDDGWTINTHPKIVGEQARVAGYEGGIGSSFTYDGGNSANNNGEQLDNPRALKDSYNPPLPLKRVTISGTRFDGTPMKVGEPLVKKRFALSRLLWLTYRGPSANVSKSDPLYNRYLKLGMPQDELDKLWDSGTPENIQNYFGLKWRADGDYANFGHTGSWEYNHGFSGAGSDGKTCVIIGSLDQVVSVGREPDFFELLKAGIAAGSVAKAFLATGQDTESPVRDSAHNLQIFQIGVNIIDGANPTLFPTCIRIEYGDGSGYKRAIMGSMDLPHWLGYCKAYILSEEAVPPVPVKLDANGYIESVELYNNDKLSSNGSIAAMTIPMVWNPYDYDANNPVPSNLSPGQMRVTAASEDLLTGSPDFIRTEIQSRAQIADKVGTSGTNDQLVGRILNGQYGGDPKPSFSGTPTPDRPLNNDTNKGGWPTGQWYGNGFEAIDNNPQPGMNSRWTRENTALEFDYTDQSLFRDPTVLFRAGLPVNSGLRMGGDNVLGKKFSKTGVKDTTGDGPFVGFLLCKIPQRVSFSAYSMPDGTRVYDTFTINWALSSGATRWVTFRLEYMANGKWVPYEEVPNRFDYSGVWLPIKADGSAKFPSLLKPVQNAQWNQMSYGSNKFWDSAERIKDAQLAGGRQPIVTHGQYRGDPRTSRFGTPNQNPPPRLYKLLNDEQTKANSNDVVTAWSWRATSAALNPNSTDNGYVSGIGYNSEVQGVGWFYPGSFGYRLGAQEQNLSVNKGGSAKTTVTTNDAGQTHYQDPDQVVRRAMGGWVKDFYEGKKDGSTEGLPMAVPPQPGARPIILHRPYRTVAELGTVFRGTPWKNIDFSFPESGDTALLDIFCINADDRSDSLIAGKVDLNTKQTQVLKALLAGAYRDELNPNNLDKLDNNQGKAFTESEAENIAAGLVVRTGTRPLDNLAHLVGYLVENESGAVSSAKSNYRTNFEPFGGFGLDIGNYVANGETTANYLVQRFRESAVRALSDAGQVGTWNLMIDVVAQTGRYPQAAGNLDDFQVEGECRYWVHLAIDRLTGQIIDKQIEQVNK